jgi:soluble lytic murein transglycosylase-like protein
VLRLTLLLLGLLAVLAGVAAASRTPSPPAQPSTGPAQPAPVAQRTATAPACPVPARWRAAFRAAAADARLPAALLAAVAHVESRFHANARSPRGAVGLLQVMPETAALLGLDASDPATNVLAGARFLRAMLDRFGAMDVALAAYNAVPAAVERAGGAPSGETLRYVLDVNARWRASVGCRA